jgi:hypothetical protein
MSKHILAIALGLALALPGSAFAQEGSEEGYERGQLYSVATFDVPPAKAAAWEGHLQKLAEAAVTAQIPYRWVIWQSGSRYTLAFPIDNFAYFDDPMQFVRAFSGTPVEEDAMAAMNGLQQIPVPIVAEELVEHKADWSYEVEGFGYNDMAYAHIDVMWPTPGMDEKFEELNKEWIAMFTDVAYPYPYAAHAVHFGDVERVVYFTFCDDLGKFYGENSPERYFEAQEMGERAQKAEELFAAAVQRWEHYDAMLRRDISYWPVEEEGETN